MMDFPAKGSRLADLLVPRIGIDGVRAYLEVSGDDNPIHTDPDLARRAGLAGLPVPGMLVMGIIGNALEVWLETGTVHRLSVSFVSPTLVDGALTIGGKVVAVNQTTRTAVIRITATQSNKLTAMGEAELVLAAP
jgi:acyl dehydratase